MTVDQTLSIYSRQLSRHLITEIKRRQQLHDQEPSAHPVAGDPKDFGELLPLSDPETIEVFWTEVEAILRWTKDRELERLIFQTPRERLGPYKSLSGLRSNLSKMHRTLKTLQDDPYLQFALPSAYVLRDKEENLASDVHRAKLQDEIAEGLKEANQRLLDFINEIGAWSEAAEYWAKYLEDEQSAAAKEGIKPSAGRPTDRWSRPAILLLAGSWRHHFGEDSAEKHEVAFVGKFVEFVNRLLTKVKLPHDAGKSFNHQLDEVLGGVFAMHFTTQSPPT